METSTSSGAPYEMALEESKRLWRLHGEQLDQLDRGLAAVERLRVIECFLSESDQMSEAVNEITKLAETWEVTVVVPIQHLGDAHEHFRGLIRVMLQGWWTNAQDEVRFGVPEIP
jgi:hypothetical protein